MDAYNADLCLLNKDIVTAGQVQIILLQQFQMTDLFLLKEVELRVKEETKKGVINQLNQGGLEKWPMGIVRLLWTEPKQPL